MGYLCNENFTFNEKVVTIDKMSDNEINEKYKKGEVRIVTEQGRYPIDTIPNLLETKKYALNPEYQRRKRWDNGKKSRLIESFIMNVPLPPIFLYEIDYAEYEVMDGLQRLTAINDFYSNKFELSDLEYWKELEGRTYSTLPDEIRKGIDRRYISSIILLAETANTVEEAESLKQIVFERLNSGGDKLTPQESRNALYSGVFNTLCVKLSENKKFREMWQVPHDTDEEEVLLNNKRFRTMEDVELVLRFFAFRFLNEYSNNIVNFLDKYLKHANKLPKDTIQSLEELFIWTINSTYSIFGKLAFIIPKDKRQSTTPSKIIYDSLLQSIIKNKNYIDAIISNNLIDSLIKEYNGTIHAQVSTEGKVLFDGKYNHAGVIQKRIAYYDNLFKNVIEKNK